MRPEAMILLASAGACLLAASAAPEIRYDLERPVTVTGVVLSSKVTTTEARGPRVVLTLAQSGSPRVWSFDAGPPNVLRRSGIGDEYERFRLVIHGYPQSSPSCAVECQLRLRSMTFEDGRKIFVGVSGVESPRAP